MNSALCSAQEGLNRANSRPEQKKKKASLEGILSTHCWGTLGCEAFCFSTRVAAGGKGDSAFPHCRLFCGAEQHKMGATEKEPTFAINTHTKCAFLRASSFLSCGNLKCGFAALLGVTAVRHWVVSYRVAPTVLKCAFQWPFFQNWF